MQDPVQSWTIFVLVLVTMVARWAYKAGKDSVRRTLGRQVADDLRARHAREAEERAERHSALGLGVPAGKVRVRVGGSEIFVDEEMLS